VGVIKKQSIKASILTYIGFCLGAVNLFVLYANFFTPEQLGLTQVFVAIATPLIALSGLGMIPLVHKFFPYYKAHLTPEQRDLFQLTVIVAIVGFSIVMLLVFLNQDFIYRKFGKSPLLVDYFYLMPILASGMLCFSLLASFVNNLKFTVYTAFCNQILFRVLVMAGVIMVAISWISFEWYMYLFSSLYWLISIVLIWKLWKEKALVFPGKWSRLTKRLKNSLIQFAGFYAFVRIFGSLSLFVDVIAVAGLQGLAQTAYFTVAIYFISVIAVPQKALINISIPVISDAWRRNDLKEIQTIYQKSSTVLLIVGGVLFLLFWWNMGEFLSFMPENYAVVAKVFLILGIAQLIDMVSGVNVQVLANSKKYWKVNVISNALLVLVLIPLNLFLINAYGIVGAAYARLIGLGLFNLFRGYYLYWHEGLRPFSKRILWLIALISVNVIAAYFVNAQLDVRDMGLLQTTLLICLKSTAFLLINLPLIYHLKLSMDINQMIDQGLVKIKLKRE
jgi:O-antigen/teichoic acid export membrane protein